MRGIFKIDGVDYSKYLKKKTGLEWGRQNTNDEDAGRDKAEVMHTEVTSHQRTLEVKMGPMRFEIVRLLEIALQGHDDGIRVTYPDIHDGVCTRLFYNTSVKAAIIAFEEDETIVDDVSFQLVSVKEDLEEDD